MLIQSRKITETIVARLQTEIQEFRNEAESISERVIPEDSPQIKSLWENYVKSWVIPKERNDICMIFRDRHCDLVFFGESLPDKMKHNSVLQNHEFFLRATMKGIARDLGISFQEFYDSGTYEADLKFPGGYFC
jgi:hypothetical protein